MNKRKARETALKGDLTIGGLRQMINDARGRGGTSNVNPAFPLEQTLDIYDAAIEGRRDDECPPVLKVDPYSRSGRMKPTGDCIYGAQAHEYKNIARAALGMEKI